MDDADSCGACRQIGWLKPLIARAGAINGESVE